jgi:hypothetical protein
VLLLLHKRNMRAGAPLAPAPQRIIIICMNAHICGKPRACGGVLGGLGRCCRRAPLPPSAALPRAAAAGSLWRVVL